MLHSLKQVKVFGVGLDHKTPYLCPVLRLLEAEACRIAVCRAGFQLEQPAFTEMMKAFDPERKGKISYAPYIAMTLFIRCAANAFQAFDAGRTGRVALDFSQFIYAASNCR